MKNQNVVSGRMRKAADARALALARELVPTAAMGSRALSRARRDAVAEAVGCIHFELGAGALKPGCKALQMAYCLVEGEPCKFKKPIGWEVPA